MSLTTLQGYRFPESYWQFSADRVQQLRAVLGCESDYERAPPTLAFSADLDGRVIEQLFEVSGLAPHQLLHGEQHFLYQQTLQPGIEYRVSGEITRVERKPQFDLLRKATRLEDAQGRTVCEMSSVYVAIAQPKEPVSGPLLEEQESDPKGYMDCRVKCTPITRERIAAFATASGDHNPVHLDSKIAQAAGHQDVFAQGMLGMGLLGGAIPQGELLRFGVRFISPIRLNEQPLLYRNSTSPMNLYMTGKGGHIRIKGYAELVY